MGWTGIGPLLGTRQAATPRAGSHDRQASPSFLFLGATGAAAAAAAPCMPSPCDPATGTSIGMKGCGAVPPEAVRAPVLAASVLALRAVRLVVLPCSCPDGSVPAPKRLTGRLLAAAAMLRFTTGRDACRVRCMQLLLQVVCVAHAAACAVWQLLVCMLLHGASPGPPARQACNSLDACNPTRRMMCWRTFLSDACNSNEAAASGRHPSMCIPDSAAPAEAAPIQAEGAGKPTCRSSQSRV